MSSKIEEAQKILKEMNVDGWIIFSDEAQDIHAQLLLKKKLLTLVFILVTPENVKLTTTSLDYRTLEDSDSIKKIEVKKFMRIEECENQIREMLSKLPNESTVFINYDERDLGFNAFDLISHGKLSNIKKIAPHLKFESAAPFLNKLRSTKTKEEIKAHEEACKLTTQILEDLPNFVSVGMTEREIVSKINSRIFKFGEPAFGTIAASGKNSAIPHHISSSKKLRDGELLLIDLGISRNEAVSDLSWTFFAGKKTPEAEFMYNLVYVAKEKIIESAKVGASGRELDYILRKELERHGYDIFESCPHASGHPIGIESHDVGVILTKRVESKLKENMVIAIEPAFYVKDFGGVRLEDNIVIKKNGCKRLSKTPTEIVQI